MIRTENLTKRYRRNVALHGVTLEVPEGSVFALVGPNGAGKSTAITVERPSRLLCRYSYRHSSSARTPTLQPGKLLHG